MQSWPTSILISLIPAQAKLNLLVEEADRTCDSNKHDPLHERRAFNQLGQGCRACMWSIARLPRTFKYSYSIDSYEQRAIMIRTFIAFSTFRRLRFSRLPTVFLVKEYTSIQMKCQGGVIFVQAPKLFYCPKRRIGYARYTLTGNKNYSTISKLTNTR